MSEKSDHVASEILSYLTRNPCAQDTLTGIVEWWLRGLENGLESGDRPWAEVEQALKRLHGEGYLVAVRAADGRVRFGLAPERREAALRRLVELERRSGRDDLDHAERNESR